MAVPATCGSVALSQMSMGKSFLSLRLLASFEDVGGGGFKPETAAAQAPGPGSPARMLSGIAAPETHAQHLSTFEPLRTEAAEIERVD